MKPTLLICLVVLSASAFARSFLQYVSGFKPCQTRLSSGTRRRQQGGSTPCYPWAQRRRSLLCAKPLDAPQRMSIFWSMMVWIIHPNGRGSPIAVDSQGMSIWLLKRERKQFNVTKLSPSPDFEWVGVWCWRRIQQQALQFCGAAQTKFWLWGPLMMLNLWMPLPAKLCI